MGITWIQFTSCYFEEFMYTCGYHREQKILVTRKRISVTYMIYNWNLTEKI